MNKLKIKKKIKTRSTNLLDYGERVSILDNYDGLGKRIFKLIILLFIFLIIIMFLKKEKDNDVNKPEYSKSTEINEKEKSKKEDKKLESEISDVSEKILLYSNSIINKFSKTNDIQDYDFREYKQNSDGLYLNLNESVEYKTSFKKVLMIKFNKRYKNEVFNEVFVDTKEEDIIKKIGQPNLNLNGNILYITKEFYVIFSTKEKEITIYSIKYNESQNRLEDCKYIFEKHFEYLKTKDVKKYISDITKKIPAYYKYDYDKNYVELIFTDLGIKITYGKENVNGIYVYSEFLKPFGIFNKSDREILEFINRNFNNRKDKDSSKITEINIKKQSLCYNLNLEDKEKNEKRKLEARELTKKLISEDNKKRHKIPSNVNVYYNKIDDNSFINLQIIYSDDSFAPKKISDSGYANEFIIYNYKLYFSIDYDGIYYYDLNTNETKKILKIRDYEISLKKLEEVNGSTRIYYNNSQINI